MKQFSSQSDFPEVQGNFIRYAQNSGILFWKMSLSFNSSHRILVERTALNVNSFNSIAKDKQRQHTTLKWSIYTLQCTIFFPISFQQASCNLVTLHLFCTLLFNLIHIPLPITTKCFISYWYLPTQFWKFFNISINFLKQ